MLVKFFSSGYLYTPVLLLATGLLLWLESFIQPGAAVSGIVQNQAPLYRLITPYFLKYPFMAVLLSFLLLMIQVFYVNHIASQIRISDKFSALAGLIYLLLMSSTPEMIAPHPTLFANLFLLFAIKKIFTVYGEDKLAVEVFNAAALIALAGMFYLSSLIFFFLLIFSLLIYYVVSPRAIVAAFLGVLAPYFFLLLVFYVDGSLADKLQQFEPNFVFWHLFRAEPGLTQIIFAVLLALYTLYALIRIRFVFVPDKPVRVRKQMHVLMLSIIVALIPYVFAIDYTVTHYAIFACPVAVTLAVFFYEMPAKKFSEVLFGILLLAVVAARFF